METISDGELVDCPICSNKFKTDQIEVGFIAFFTSNLKTKSY